MRITSLLITLAATLLVAPAANAEGGSGGLAAFGGPTKATGPCVTPEDRARVAAQIAEWEAEHGVPEPVVGTGAAMPFRGIFPFFPQGGNVNSDLFHNNFVDLDPTSGVLDFECTDRSYNGHNGHDSDIRTFDEQEIGIPIFAALDGVCIARDDGHPDMNTSLGNQPANFVILQHDNGLRTYYFHFKRDTVQPIVGQEVEAGESLGLTGSSGNSTGPHLHFEVHQAGSVVEPSAGICRPGDSLWANPFPIRRDTYLRDFGFARGDVFPIAGLPHPFPRSKQVTFDDTIVSYWIQGHNLPQNSTYQFRFFRPDGTLEFNTGTLPLGFSTSGFFRNFWAGFTWNVPAMRTIAGDWTVEIDLNGENHVSVPVRVHTTEVENFNRVPYQVGVTLDPPNPDADDVIIVSIDTDLVNDDPEFDVLRYDIVYILNGSAVRHVNVAGHADALPASIISPGDVLDVFVTPFDDTFAFGPFTGVTVTIGEPCNADCNQDGSVDFGDLVAMLFQFGSFGTQGCNADGSMFVEFGDLVAALFEFGPCE